MEPNVFKNMIRFKSLQVAHRVYNYTYLYLDITTWNFLDMIFTSIKGNMPIA